MGAGPGIGDVSHHCEADKKASQHMSLDALRTKLDSLVWENSQLQIKNRRLRESNLDQVAMVDREAELERSKEDTVHFTEQLGCLEKKLNAALQRVEWKTRKDSQK